MVKRYSVMATLDQAIPIVTNTCNPPFIAVRINPDENNEYNTTGVIYCIPEKGINGVSPPVRPLLERIVSRGLDITLSICALIAFLPVMLLISLIIRLDSPGPILFFQRRITKSKLVSGEELLNSKKFNVISKMINPSTLYWIPKTFCFIKFRTMYADAKERFPHLYDYNLSPEEILQFQFKVENDPRVTRAGKWLRESTLDELPNFWNVLIGEMKLAGPRPEIPEMLPNYTPAQMGKFTVKPGVSGLAQINGRGRLMFQQTVGYDLEYVRGMSLAFDVKIILKTVFKVFYRHGAF